MTTLEYQLLKRPKIKWAILIPILVGIVSSIIGLLANLLLSSIAPELNTTTNYLLILSYPITTLIMVLIWTTIIWILSKLFRGKGTFIGLFRNFGLSSILFIFGAVPIVGLLTGVWGVVTSIFIVKSSQKLSGGKATLVVLIPIILLFLLYAIIFAFLVSSMAQLIQ